MTLTNYVTVPVSRDNINETFTVNSKYRIIRKVGSGAYGTVCSAFDMQYQRFCAIKKVYRVFDKRLLSKRTLREIKLLRLFNNHPRIIELFDMDMVPGTEEIYLIFGCMDASLHDVIHSQQPLDTVHAQWFLYQMLSGLKYIHNANVIHRDLKPANILVNKDCDIRICDFGMARCFDEADTSSCLTQYVTTRWYRAPEVMISLKNYSKAIDIWSIGCILAEVIGRKVLFQGKDHVDQLYKILGVLGVPSDISFWNPSEYIINHIQQLRTTNGSPPPTETIDFHTLFPNTTSDAVNILKGLLELNPSKRLTAEHALSHPFIQPFSDPAEESLIPPLYPSSHYGFELCHDDEELKTMIINEIESFKNYQQEREAKLMTNDKFIDSSNLFHFHPHPSQNRKKHHTVSLVELDYYSPTPTQKLDYLPSATMSLLEHMSPFFPPHNNQESNITASNNKSDAVHETDTFMCSEDAFVGEPEELDEDDRYSYLGELKKITPGIEIIDSDRQLHEPVEEEARRTLERALSGMSQQYDNANI